MTEDDAIDHVPAIAIYSEWLGEDQTPQVHTLRNIATSMAAQNADTDQVIMTAHIHPGYGAWVVATAPVKAGPPDAVRILFRGEIS